MIAIFATRNLGQQSWSGQAFLDGRRWLRSCDHATTADAGVLGPHFFDHMERGGEDLHPFATLLSPALISVPSTPAFPLPSLPIPHHPPPPPPPPPPPSPLP